MSGRKTTQWWLSYFENRGISESVIAEYIPYIRKLQKNRVPVIFEFEHLSRLLGLRGDVLAKIVNSPESFSRKFSIPKRRGGKREIISPYPSLLHCQKWIYRHILQDRPVSASAHGFTKGRSIVTNAANHLSQKVLLKMDLENFFPSIPINWVVNYFSSLGYSNNVAFYLSAMCCYEKKLSQGSATSPCLSNLLLAGLDERFLRLSKKYGLTYSRYADDLTFSGAYIPVKYVGIVSSIVDSYGLTVNGEKTRLHTKPGQRIVTGLSVAGEALRLPRATKRKLRQEVHFIRKFGFLSHVSKTKIGNAYYLESLIGKLGFWLQVEPTNEFANESFVQMRILQKSLER